MTRVELQRDEAGLCGFEVSGHSGYAEEGSDIVCAAVSVLITTCANALEEIIGIAPYVESLPRRPRMLVRLPENFPSEKRHDADIILRAALRGLKDVQAQYPRYLHIK